MVCDSSRLLCDGDAVEPLKWGQNNQAFPKNLKTLELEAECD